MKKFLGLLVMFMMIASNCLAMTFSQPVKLGGAVRWSQMGGFYIMGESTNNEVKENYFRRGKVQGFAKGVAQFGNGVNAVYEHYNIEKYKHYIKVGSYNEENTISIPDHLNMNISLIPSDNEIIFYIIETGYDIAEDGGYIIFGKRRDGRFVKYIDTYEVQKKYFGQSMVVALNNPQFHGDTIVIPYGKGFQGHNYKKIGEFRFKWDDKAQWFGVEQVIY